VHLLDVDRSPVRVENRKPDDGAGPAPKSEECRLAEFFIRSVNFLTPLDRFLNDAAERGPMGRPSEKCRINRHVQVLGGDRGGPKNGNRG
jgi:hypothetical protein